MLVNVRNKEGKKPSLVSLRRQNGYLIPQPHFFVSGLQMQVFKHTNSQLHHFRGMAT